MQFFIVPIALAFQLSCRIYPSILFSWLLTFVIAPYFDYYTLPPISALPSTTCITRLLMIYQPLVFWFLSLQHAAPAKVQNSYALANWSDWLIEPCSLLSNESFSIFYQFMPVVFQWSFAARILFERLPHTFFTSILIAVLRQLTKIRLSFYHFTGLNISHRDFWFCRFLPGLLPVVA